MSLGNTDGRGNSKDGLSIRRVGPILIVSPSQFWASAMVTFGLLSEKIRNVVSHFRASCTHKALTHKRSTKASSAFRIAMYVVPNYPPQPVVRPSRTLVNRLEVFTDSGGRFFSYTYLENNEYYFAMIDVHTAHDLYSLRGHYLPKTSIYAPCPYDLWIAKPDVVRSSGTFIKECPIVIFNENADVTKMRPITEELIPEARVYQTLMSVKGGPHPNICRYYGVVATNGYLTGVVLQRCRTTLYALHKSGAKFDDNFVNSVAGGIRAALDHLHSLGLAHVSRLFTLLTRSLY